MAIVNIQQIVALTLQLFDGDSGKFPLAWVTNDQGQQLIGSPFSLALVSGGLYENTSLVYPAGTDFIVAQYKVYNDPGHTILSPIHADAQDVFYKNGQGSPLVLQAELITGNVREAASIGGIMKAELVAEEVNEAMDLTGETLEASTKTQTLNAEITDG